MTPDSLHNALTADMALGCSTNTVLHLPAIAHELLLLLFHNHNHLLKFPRNNHKITFPFVISFNIMKNHDKVIFHWNYTLAFSTLKEKSVLKIIFVKYLLILLINHLALKYSHITKIEERRKWGTWGTWRHWGWIQQISFKFEERHWGLYQISKKVYANI